MKDGDKAIIWLTVFAALAIPWLSQMAIDMKHLPMIVGILMGFNTLVIFFTLPAMCRLPKVLGCPSKDQNVEHAFISVLSCGLVGFALGLVISPAVLNFLGTEGLGLQPTLYGSMLLAGIAGWLRWRSLGLKVVESGNPKAAEGGEG